MAVNPANAISELEMMESTRAISQLNCKRCNTKVCTAAQHNHQPTKTIKSLDKEYGKREFKFYAKVKKFV